MNNLKKRDQYIQEELKPWSDHDSSLSGEESGNFSIKGFKGNSYNDSFDEPDTERAKKFRERYMKPKSADEMISIEKAKNKAWEAWVEVCKRWAEDEGWKTDDIPDDRMKKEFEDWWNENNFGSEYKGEPDENGWLDQAGMGMSANRKIGPEDGMHENMLPKPYKKVKCAECGEEVCDNINFKIGHLYNRHNCKPSVGDYKARRMMVQYFPPK